MIKKLRRIIALVNNRNIQFHCGPAKFGVISIIAAFTILLGESTSCTSPEVPNTTPTTPAPLSTAPHSPVPISTPTSTSVNRPPDKGILPLVLFYYGDATPDVDPIIIGIRPQYLVTNPSHGLWGEISGHSPKVFQDISAYKAADIKIIGYLTAGYEGTQSGGKIEPKWYSLEMNKKLIRDMAEIDHVDGIFFDECSAFPDDKGKKYLKELTDFAHSYGLITWGNVGGALFSPWFFTDGGFDLVHSNENWHGQNLSQIQSKWGDRISVTGFHSGYTVQDALNLPSEHGGKVWLTVTFVIWDTIHCLTGLVNMPIYYGNTG